MPVPRGAVGCCSPPSSTRLLLHPPRPQGLLQPSKARRVGKLLPLILQPFLPSGAGDSFSTFLSSLRHWRQKWDGCHQPSKASSRSFFQHATQTQLWAGLAVLGLLSHPMAARKGRGSRSLPAPWSCHFLTARCFHSHANRPEHFLQEKPRKHTLHQLHCLYHPL